MIEKKLRIAFFCANIAFLYAFVFAQETAVSEINSIKGNVLSDKIAFYKQKNMNVLTNTTGTIGPGKFVIVENYSIDDGQTLIINAGTQIFCENNVSIKVFGKIITKGTPADKVFFSSLPIDQHYLPPSENESIWDGIYIKDNAHIEFSSTSIFNCRNSITATDKTSSIKFYCVSFTNTGNYQLLLGDIYKVFSDRTCVNFSSQKKTTTKNTSTVATAKMPPEVKSKNILKPLLVSLCAVATVGCFATGMVIHSKATDLNKLASETKSLEAQKYLDDRNEKIKQRNILWGIACGSASLGIVFVFAIK